VFKKLRNDHETKTETQPVSNKTKNETKTSQTCLNTKTKSRDLTTLGLSPWNSALLMYIVTWTAFPILLLYRQPMHTA